MCHYALLEGTADGDGTTWLEPYDDHTWPHTDDQAKHRLTDAAHHPGVTHPVSAGRDATRVLFLL